MSWIDRVNSGLRITTGDGRTFTPNWLNAAKDKEWNVAEFEFPEVSGSLVRRRKPKGRKYNIEIYFQGEDHVDQANDFEESSEDERPWTIIHPFYGSLLVQPIRLSFDNKEYNVTKITGVIAETIDTAPKTKIDPVDFVSASAEELNTTIADMLVLEIPQMQPAAFGRISQNITQVYEDGKKKIKETSDSEYYFNLFNEANDLIVDITAEPLAAIRGVQAFLNAPSFFIDSVENRIVILVSQFNQLRTSIEELLTRDEKKVYENNAGVVISSIAQASVYNYDYENRQDVLDTIDIILEQYNQYIEDLDSLQTENANSPESYIPDADSMMKLSSLINFVVSNLFIISTSARQERSTFVETDTNVINLAHRFYGLKPDDSTIDKFIKDNNIGLDEHLQIRKGREVIWYV